MNQKLDVVIPVLMPSRFLSQHRSHLKGLCPSLRVIYVLDFSKCQKTKKTLDLTSSSKELFLYGDYGSPGAARNAGLLRSDAEYICFWDVDDEANLEQVCSSFRKLIRNGSELIIGRWNISSRDSNPKSSNPLNVGLDPGLWRFIFKRTLIGDSKFSHLKWGEDQLFIAQILKKNPSVLNSDDVLYVYSKGVDGSLSGDKGNVKALRIVFSECLAILNSLSQGPFVVVCIMLIRQSLTMLKLGNSQTKLFALKGLLISIRKLLSFRGLRAFSMFTSKWE